MTHAQAFSKIPLELLLRITNDLTTKDICNLRLACRSIEVSLYGIFSNAFFTKKQFMLSYTSLQALIGISKSRLGASLKHVIIGLDRFHQYQAFPKARGGNVADALMISKYVEGLHDQQALLESGDAVSFLSTAFSELGRKSLKVVGIRDYASDGRSERDGPGSLWTSYGATTIQRETGVSLLDSFLRSYGFQRDDYIYSASQMARQVFRVVLLALGTARVAPASIEVLRQKGSYLPPGAFHIPTHQEPIILPILDELESLSLPVGFRRDGRPMHHITSCETVSPCPDFSLRLFLGYLSSIKHLRLEFIEGDVSTFAFLQWLGDPTNTIPQADDSVLPSSPKPVEFSNLIDLSLCSCKVEPESLLRIMHKFAPTLQKVELWRITLDTRGNRFYETAPDIDPEPCIWTTFLRNLREIEGLNLSYFVVQEPKQCRQPCSFDEPVLFKSLAQTRHNNQIVQRLLYTGMDWKSFVGDAAEDVCILDSEDEDMEDESE
ncbi:hypothetical protein ACJ41O_010352 [Fusarium nematophilum]